MFLEYLIFPRPNSEYLFHHKESKSQSQVHDVAIVITTQPDHASHQRLSLFQSTKKQTTPKPFFFHFHSHHSLLLSTVLIPTYNPIHFTTNTLNICPNQNVSIYQIPQHHPTQPPRCNISIIVVQHLCYRIRSSQSIHTNPYSIAVVY